MAGSAAEAIAMATTVTPSPVNLFISSPVQL
jgi:hypothetical protein